MKILGFVKTSTVDYPAKVVASIFLGGCNLDCEYCQNRDLINPGNIEPIISEDELLIYLKKRKGIIDGLCISGGEPTLHGIRLSSFMKRIKEELGTDFLIKLDTNGTNPEFLRENKAYIDYVAMDYKTFEYEKNLGIPKAKILESINVLKESYPDYEIRITMYPPYVKLIDIVFMVEELRGIKKLYLQNYRVVDGASTETYTEINMADIAKEFRGAKIECEIR